MDPYQLLGVSRSATEAEIKSAYRKLAKKLHPDMNPGRKDIEQKFKEVTSAYDLLSDRTKRARFDRGEIDESGNEKRYQRSGFSGEDPYASMRGKRRGSSNFGGFNPEDIFSEFFGGGKRGFEGARNLERGEDLTYTLSVPFVEACLGGKKRVTLAGGKTIDVTIPQGTEDGHKLRLRGLGQQGSGGAGDALVEIRIEPHPFFTREGNDIHLDVPVSLPEAVMGANIKVPTLAGSVSLKIHKGATGASVMRLKGKGVPSAGGAGDMFVKLKIVLPENEESLETLAAAIEKWAKKNAYDPRKKTGWT